MANVVIDGLTYLLTYLLTYVVVSPVQNRVFGSHQTRGVTWNVFAVIPADR